MDVVGDIFLQIPCGDEGVDIDLRHPALYGADRLGVGDALDPHNLHGGHRLPPHQQLPDPQIRGAYPPPQQGGVGTHGLHKGIPRPFERRLVLRIGNGPLLLGPYIKGEDLLFPWKKEDAIPANHIEYGLVHRGAFFHP